MNLIEATKYCFRNALNFSGRANRYEFWNFALFLLIGSVFLVILNSIIFGPTVEEGVRVTIDSSGNQTSGQYRNTSYNGGILGTIFAIVTFVPALAVTWRRLHDISKPGWVSLLPWALLAAMAAIWALTSSPVNVGTDPTSGEALFVMMPSSIAPVAVPGLLALVTSIYLFVLLVRKSDPNTNRFGPNPNEVPS